MNPSYTSKEQMNMELMQALDDAWNDKGEILEERLYYDHGGFMKQTGLSYAKRP